MERLGYCTNTTYKDGKTIIETRKAHGYYLPNKKTTIEDSGIITVEHNYENGLSVVRKKDKGPFRITRITKRDLRVPLYDERPASIAKKPIICEETIKEYAMLNERLKKVCRPYIESLIKEIRKALK